MDDELLELSPKKAHFRIDYNSPSSSPWNKGTWEIFWNDFLKIGYARSSEKEMVQKAYDTYVHNLRRHPPTSLRLSKQRQNARLLAVSPPAFPTRL